MTTPYATVADWATYIGTTAPANVNALLRRATLDVNRVLIAAVYDDTDVAILAALAEATCEQADSLRATGSEDGNPNPYQSVSAGSISLTRGSSSSGATADGTEISARAFTVLQNAGLTGAAPSTGWE